MGQSWRMLPLFPEDFQLPSAFFFVPIPVLHCLNLHVDLVILNYQRIDATITVIRNPLANIYPDIPITILRY